MPGRREFTISYGEPSDRIDVVTPGGPSRTWNTTFTDVRGLDASGGDRLLLATRIDLLNARFYAAALSPSGTVTDSYFVTAPSVLDPDGIGTSNAQNGGQPTVFQPGRQQFVFELPFTNGAQTCHLDGLNAQAKTNSPRC